MTSTAISCPRRLSAASSSAAARVPRPPRLRAELEVLAAVQSLLCDARFPVNRCNSDGDSLLMVEARKGHQQVVQYLLSHSLQPLDIDRQNAASGFTALLYASRGGHRAVVCSLVAAGADSGRLMHALETQTVSALLPLDSAARLGVAEAARSGCELYRARLRSVLDEQLCGLCLPAELQRLILHYVLL